MTSHLPLHLHRFAQIRGLPTLVFVSKDKEKLAKRTEGVLPVEALKELIEDL